MAANNAEVVRLIQIIGKTPGFAVQGTSEHAFKAVRLALPQYGLNTASVKISPRLHDRQLANVVTRLKRMGWTEDLYDQCQKLAEEHRAAGTDPTEDQRRLLLEALGRSPEANSPAAQAPTAPPPQRRHGRGGTATGSAKTAAGKAIPADTADPADPARVVVIPGARIQPEIISPERALELLDNVAAYQRQVKDKKVHAYAEAMKRGEWTLLASDPICIDVNGKTANGQHRLTAVLECMQPQPFYVAYGVPVEDYRHMDRGIKRSTADMLHGAGEASSFQLAAVARLAFLWFNVEDQSQWRAYGDVTESQVLATLDAHPGLRESVKLGKIPGTKVSRSGAQLVHYLITRKLGGDPSLVTRWYQAIGEMDLERGTPGHTLGLYLLKTAPGATRRTTLEGRSTRDLHMYLLMREWNNTCLGKTVRNISWKTDFIIPKPLLPSPHHTFPPVA